MHKRLDTSTSEYGRHEDSTNEGILIFMHICISINYFLGQAVQKEDKYTVILFVSSVSSAKNRLIKRNTKYNS